MRILLLFLFISFLGCTRPLDSNVSLNLSSEAISSLGEPRVLVVNVSGPNMQRVRYFWECDDECVATDVPTSIQLEIPSGSQRLVQVLMAYEDDDIELKYADAVLDLSGSSASVNLAPITIVTSPATFDFGGRYSPDGINFPSGWYDMVFTPAGKPPMVIESHFMFAGWFQFFGLQGAGFSYVRKSDGAPLFTNVDIIESAGPTYSLQGLPGCGSDNCITIIKPPHYKLNGTCELQKKEFTVLGFFGNLTTLDSQYSDTSTDFGGLFDNNACASTPYYYEGILGAVANRARPVLGSGFSTPCMALTEFGDCLAYNHLGINRDRPYEFKFRGPFQLINPDFLEVTHENNLSGGAELDISVYFNLLPDTYGSTNSPIKGVDVFYRTGFDFNIERVNLEDIQCELLALSNSYYAHLDSNISVGVLTGNITINDITPVLGTSKATIVYACPYTLNGSSKVYYNDGAVYSYTATP